ncbi:MAG: ABC transporter permease, partial [Candidatus Latescibacterota bacterium]|nr:ABC transporter permease [Candidatus Latescibacterota bacterium]
VELRLKHDKNIKDVLVDIRGALRLLPRKSTIPTEPVPFGVVALEPPSRQEPWRPHMALADARGEYRINGLPPGRVELQAFLLDEETGAISYATDMGERAQAFGAFERTLTKAETQWTTILFPAESVEIYDRIHAHFLCTMGSNNTNLQILDKRGAKPKQFGYALGDWMSASMLLFGARDESLRVVDRSVFLLNNSGATDEESAQGRGYDLGGQRLIRGGTLEFAKNMWVLDEVRYERMRRYAIENPRIQARHQRAEMLIERAEEARDELRWEAYTRYARAALGTENQAYGDVVATQNDVVVGIVFFVALLIPAAFFAERLLFAAPDIRRQLALTALITLAIWILLSQVHPAFQLAHPVIVLLALMILVMAFFVISLVMGRFNTFMEEQRHQRAGTESADISRSGTSYVAFMLGISNMRRRPLRTTLTLLTITLLTFTVLSFTSFEPQISYVGFDKEWEPAYHGALFHDVQWWWWEYSIFDYIESHFGAYGTVVPRTWLSAGFAEAGYIPIQRAGRQVDVLALMGLGPQEPGVTGVARALTAGSWFAEEREESVLLPEAMAAQLGIGPEDVGEATVAIFGQEWRVRGLYDPLRYSAITDLTDEPLTPAKQKFEQNFMPGMEQLTLSLYNADVNFDVSFEHLDPERIAILPYSVLESMDAPLYSVAVRFGEGVASEELVQAFLSRTGFRIFVGLPDEDGQLHSLAYTSLGVTSMEGLGSLVIPMLIAALIVLNTMMGAVYERFREIGVYSSVGLAPVHIAFLFIAEASVYGVLGVTVGYLVGQVTAKVLIVFDLLGGVSLNYSSLSAIASSLLVMAVVLLSALYPARVASQLAVPDVVRRWQLPDPEDDVWRFPFPFTLNRQAIESLCGYLYTYFSDYGHESVGKLYTEKTRIVVSERADGERIYAVQLLVWLAPFDMGVSQYLQFTVEPTEVKNIFGIELYIERVSGPVAFWQRLNLGFMLTLRQQFLIWQTLRAPVQEEHAKVGRSVLVTAAELETGAAG